MVSRKVWFCLKINIYRAYLPDDGLELGESRWKDRRLERVMTGQGSDMRNSRSIGLETDDEGI